MEDVAATQRNIVFPATAASEARFWRNIISGNRHLTFIQVIGISFIALCLAGVLFNIVAEPLVYRSSTLTGWRFAVRAYGGYLIPLGVVGAFLLVLKFVTTSKKT